MAMLPPLILEIQSRAGEAFADLSKVQTEVAATGAEAEKSSGVFQQSASKAAGAGKIITLGVLGAAAAIGAGSVDMAAKFQQASLHLVTDAGESQKNLSMVQKGMLSLSAQTGIGADEIAKGMYLVESAGYHGAAGLKVMQAAAEGAKIGGADLATVSDALTTAMTDYHFPASQAATVTSKLIATVGQGKTTMEALAGSLHNVLPTSASLGISFAQVTGAMATMTAEGISADQASQNLNHAIISLANPTQVQTKEMAAMGLNSTTVAQQLGKKGLTGTLNELVGAITSHMGPAGTVLMSTFSHSQLAAQSAATEYKGLGGEAQKLATQYMNGSITLKQWTTDTKAMSPVQANLAHAWASSYQASKAFNTALTSNQGAAQTFTAALSKMTGGQQGLSVALHLTGDHAAAFANNVNIIGKASTESGNHVKGWAETQKLLIVQLDQAKASIEKMGIQLGSVLIPWVSKALKGAEGFVGFLASHHGVLIGIVSVLGTMAGALMAVYVAQKMMAAITAISNGVQIAANLIQGIRNVETEASIALSYGQAGATYALADAQTAWAIGSKIAAAAQWVMNGAMLASPITWIVVGIIALIAAIVLLVTHWKQVTTFLTGVWNGAVKLARQVWADLGNFFSSTMKAIQTIAVSVWKAITGGLAAAWNGIKIAALAVFNFIGRYIANVWDVIGKTIGAAIKIIIDLFTGHFSDIPKVVGQLFGRVLQDINNVFPGIIGVITRGLTAIGQFFIDAWNNLVTATVDTWQMIIDGIGNAINAVVAFFVALPGRVLNFANALWNGIVQGVQMIIQWFEQLPQRVDTFMTDFVNSIQHGIENGIHWFENLPGRVQSALAGIGSWLLSAGADLMAGLANGITGAVGNVVNSAVSAAKNAVNAVKSWLGIHSPSTRMRDEVGFFMGAGLAAGLDQSQGLVSRSMKALVQSPTVGVPSVAQSAATAAVTSAFAGSVSTSGAVQPQMQMQQIAQPVSSSRQQTVNVYAQTNATPNQIASSVGWQLRLMG